MMQTFSEGGPKIIQTNKSAPAGVQKYIWERLVQHRGASVMFVQKYRGNGKITEKNRNIKKRDFDFLTGSE